MTRLVLLTVALTAVLAAAPAGASAAWTAPALVSEVGGQQSFGGTPGSTEPDVSADGRYVVFTTSARNLVDVPDADAAFFRRGGVVRKDLATGALELVAPGDRARLETPYTDQLSGAERPSISADGRWVAFQTAEALVAQDTNGRTDVYVRDMQAALGAEGAYELVSALDGGGDAATYTSPNRGAEVARAGAAISDDGDAVLFYVGVASSLPGPADSNARQLFVRRRASQRTLTVNVRRDEATGQMTTAPADGVVGGQSALLSGDGTTVVWASSAAEASRQVRPVAGEPPTDQLLWRRLDGPTRRVTGVVDADDPGCTGGAAIGSLTAPVASPCDGPLAVVNDTVPLLTAGGPITLSRDGRTVAFVTSWFSRQQQTFLLSVSAQVDVLVVDMRDGLSRKLATREITRSEPTVSPGVRDLALSADGGTLVIGGPNIIFRLSPPNLIGIPPLDVRDPQLYVVDLTADTAEVATRGVGGASPAEPVGGGPWTPALSADARRMVFSTTATNLIAADGNQIADVFAVDRVEETVPLAAQSVPPPPSAVRLQPLRRLRVTARSLRDGRVRVTVIAPGAGALTMSARGTVPSGRRRVERTVSSGRRRAARAGVWRVDLRPSTRYRRSVPRAGLAVQVRVAFRPTTGRSGLTRTVRARFLRPARRR